MKKTKKIEVIMADPAGNRTAIVRTPVPAADRPRVAALLLDREDLRAEQVGFETEPRMGGAGRLEMMGGEFCGNAARSYGYLLWCERQGAAAPGSLLIEISGSPHLLEVVCDPAESRSFAEMPMPVSLQYSREGYPMVVSEGITHVILEDTDPREDLANQLIDRYGDIADAVGIMFLKGDRLTPFVYVGETGSRVWESSCGSGSLAAAWYLDRAGGTAGKAGLQETSEDTPAKAPASGTPASPDNGRPRAAEEGEGPEDTRVCRFREPGGELSVILRHGKDGTVTGRMGGLVKLEERTEIELRA